MIINSLKSLFTYNNRESLDLINSPDIDDKTLYTDYHNFINSVSVIYGDQRSDGTIPVFWTKIKNNETLEREADASSTLRHLTYNSSYYVVVLDSTKLPLKVPQPLDSNKFLELNIQQNNETCFNKLCDSKLVITNDSHRNISLTADTGYSTNIHIPISGLLPNTQYTYSIDPIYSNWPNKLTQSSGTVVRNSPINTIGTISSSIDSKFLYLYTDGKNNFNNSLPYDLIDIYQLNHEKNIFSLFSLKIYDSTNNILLIDTINITCNTCVPTQTIIPSPTPTPTITSTSTATPSLSAVTPTPSLSYGSSPTPTPTLTATPTNTVTPTPSETPYESNRKCPTINIREKNIILKDKNNTSIVADFAYLDPKRQYAYEFSSNKANWPAIISSRKDVISNYVTYYENNILYASGSIVTDLQFNNNLTAYTNLDYDLPKYSSENFFDDNIFINLQLKLGRYRQSSLSYDPIVGSDSCFNTIDNMNIICEECVSILDNNKNCTESLVVKIANSDLSYPILSDTSRPGSEILIDEECCNNNNILTATISGMCANNVYGYEWSSDPIISIMPASGTIVSDNISNINTIYNLGHNQIANVKLKIKNLSIGNYIEDNILIRCDDKACSTPLPTSTPQITPTPSATLGATPTPTKTVTPTATPILAPLTFDDYLLLFIDEALSPSVPGVFGYFTSDGKPNNIWYEDMNMFKDLDNNKNIDIEKILIFHVRQASCKRTGLYPTVGVNSGYEMPISTSKVIDTPRNNPKCLVNNEELTGEWIKNKVNQYLGTISVQSRINIFVDNSPSLTFEAVKSGIIAYENILLSSNIPSKRILCQTERWLRWIVSTFNGNPVCS